PPTAPVMMVVFFILADVLSVAFLQGLAVSSPGLRLPRVGGTPGLYYAYPGLGGTPGLRYAYPGLGDGALSGLGSLFPFESNEIRPGRVTGNIPPSASPCFTLIRFRFRKTSPS